MKDCKVASRFVRGKPDTVVIGDTGNYYPQQRDGCIEAIEAGTTKSRWVAQLLNRPVIKAFNNFQARTKRTPPGKIEDEESRGRFRNGDQGTGQVRLI